MTTTPAPTSRLARTIAWIGLLAGPVAFVLVRMLLPVSGVPGDGALTHAGRDVLGLGAWMAIWWLTEAVPLTATALLPILVIPLAGIGTPRQALAPYADEIIFLFLGGFILGLAVERVGLHKRLAIATLLLVGTSPARMVGGVMLATAGLSMFVSNSAAAMMMTPLALSIVALASGPGSPAPGGTTAWSRRSVEHFGAAMLLGVGYAATIGGMGTPIGTPPNAVMTGYAERVLNIQIGFGQWMAMAMPAVLLLLPLLWAMLVYVLHPVREKGVVGGRAFLLEERARLGGVSRDEWFVGAVFACTALLWIFRKPLAAMLDLVVRDAQGRVTGESLTDSVIAVLAAVTLLVVPIAIKGQRRVLTWDQAERIPWGILLLFGGGLSLAFALQHTGVDTYLAAQLSALGTLPDWAVLVLVVGGVVVFSEIAGNTAVAQIVMPILGALAVALKLDPILVLMSATLAASCGFALPVATPPNAIVFATGKIGMGRMVRAGVLLDVLSVVVIVAVMVVLVPTIMRWVGLR